MAALPSPDSFTGAVEDYAPVVLQSTCDPTDKPGVLAFRKLVLDAVGGGAGGTIRACPPPGSNPSEHAEGRAWDWSVSADKPEDVARVDAVLGWLLSPDAKGNANAMFRRAGLQYIIWNRQIWSVRTKDWQPYKGTHPHTDHVHFSFGWDGALGKTSLYEEGGAPLPPEPPQPEPPQPEPPQPSPIPPGIEEASVAPLVLAGMVGAVVAFVVARSVSRWQRGRR